ncbi:MAG: ACT domain-containing protein [Promethearchaeota archaeon]
MSKLTLELLNLKYAICKLKLSDPLPDCATLGEFWSMTHTNDEVSLIIQESQVTNEWIAELGWRILKVRGPLYFSLTGIIASLAVPLAEAKISIFATSTYDTDYIMIKETQLNAAVQVLRANGFEMLM